MRTSPSTQLAAILVGLSFCATSVRAQNPTTEAGEAAISDPIQECTGYYYAPSGSQQSNFPTIWQPATLLANDSAGQAAWLSVKPSIPTNISVKGTMGVISSNFTSGYNSSDPDCWWSFSKCLTPKLPGLKPDTATVPEPNTLGYGFDDGPNCSHNAFYDYLSQQKQKATMFYIGSNVMDWPLQAQRALADGHEICVHTWSHRYMTAFQSEDAFAELWYTKNAIKLVTGVTPTCWRPPYGDVDDRIRAIAQGLQLRTVVWAYDSNDWEVGATNGTANVTAAQVDANYLSLIAKAQGGGFSNGGTIMLTHELNNFTMQEAIKYHPNLTAAFSGGLVPILVALNQTQPYVESNYSGPSYSQYVQGEITASSSPGSSSSPSSAAQGGSNTGGTIGMPTATIGLVSVIAAFLGGVARVMVMV